MKLISNTEEQMINDIIEEFNFLKVKQAMTCLNWKWKDKAPSLTMITEKAMNLLTKACEKKVWRLGTGGFMVERTADNDNNTTKLELRFEVTSWYCSSEDLEQEDETDV